MLGGATGLTDRVPDRLARTLAAMAFGLATVIAAMMTVRSWRFTRWDRAVDDQSVIHDRDSDDGAALAGTPPARSNAGTTAGG